MFHSSEQQRLSEIDLHLRTGLTVRSLISTISADQSFTLSHREAPTLLPSRSSATPPRWCECWILWDPARASGAEKEIGGWHRPTASIFPPDSGHFAIVTVRQLDADAYSVLSCGVDWTSFKPV